MSKTKSYSINVSFSAKGVVSEKGLADVEKAFRDDDLPDHLKHLEGKPIDDIIAGIIRCGLRQDLRHVIMGELSGDDGMVFSKFSPFKVEVKPNGKDAD